MRPYGVISRRDFLSAGSFCLVSSICSQSSFASMSGALEKVEEELEQYLLGLVNAERASGDLSGVAIDALASTVSQQHAREMAEGRFLSHWSRSGLKPYHRYSFAGGFDAVAENVSGAHGIESTDPEFVRSVLTQSHVRMLSETPPNDGHRRTILAPQYTHVGFGVASSGRELRLVELFVAKHVWLAPYQTRAEQNGLVRFKGGLLSAGHVFEFVEVFFEPKPEPRDGSWLEVPRSYGLPDDFVTLRPVLPRGIQYADGTRGVVDTSSNGRFEFSVRLNKKEPGIYTVVVWIGSKKSGVRFQATNACIQSY
jgi:uncharacterized protein YkwD